MPIAAASEALASHLRSWLAEGGRAEAWPIEAMTLPEARTKPGHGISLVLWRVQPDEPAGDTSPLRTASKGDPPEGGGLQLRYLLVVRGTDAAIEQTMLARCMEVLDRHPVIEEPGSAANIAAEALVVAVETPADDAYLRLAEACGDPPPLLVPYVVRSVRLHPPVAGHIPDAPPDAGPAA